MPYQETGIMPNFTINPSYLAPLYRVMLGARYLTGEPKDTDTAITVLQHPREKSEQLIDAAKKAISKFPGLSEIINKDLHLMVNGWTNPNDLESINPLDPKLEKAGLQNIDTDFGRVHLAQLGRTINPFPDISGLFLSDILVYPPDAQPKRIVDHSPHRILQGREYTGVTRTEYAVKITHFKHDPISPLFLWQEDVLKNPYVVADGSRLIRKFSEAMNIFHKIFKPETGLRLLRSVPGMEKTVKNQILSNDTKYLNTGAWEQTIKTGIATTLSEYLQKTYIGDEPLDLLQMIKCNEAHPETLLRTSKEETTLKNLLLEAYSISSFYVVRHEKELAAIAAEIACSYFNTICGDYGSRLNNDDRSRLLSSMLWLHSTWPLTYLSYVGRQYDPIRKFLNQE